MEASGRVTVDGRLNASGQMSETLQSRDGSVRWLRVQKP